MNINWRELLSQLPTATEAKVKASAWATFLVSLAGLTLLNTTVTDMVPALPDWAETPIYSLILTASTFLAGWSKRTQPGAVSPSTRDAIVAWLTKHMPRARPESTTEYPRD